MDVKDKIWLRNADLARYLGVSNMTVWRWQRIPSMDFPKPTVINTISYTLREDIDQWMRDRITQRHLPEKQAVPQNAAQKKAAQKKRPDASEAA